MALVVWIVALVLGFCVLFKKKRSQWKDLPPGPWGLPIVGYLPFVDRHHPYVTLTELSKRYGPIYGLQMGSNYTVILSDHQLLREAFSKDVFAGRAPVYWMDDITKGNGIIFAEGALWKDQRKLVTSWLKSIGVSKHGTVREKLTKRISNGAHELIQNVNEARGSPISLPNMITNSLGNTVYDIIFGFKFPLNDKTWTWLRHMQAKGFEELGVVGVLTFLPFLRFVSPSIQKIMQLLINVQFQVHRLYVSIIATRRRMLGMEMPPEAEYKEHSDISNEHPEGLIKYIKYGDHASNNEVRYFDPKKLVASNDDCILNNFLAEQKRRYENQEENTFFMRDEQMLYLLTDIFSAGVHSTSVTFSWVILYVALHTEVQEKMREEILTVYPEECEIDNAKLPYVMAVICETQRIRTVIPLGVPHGVLQETFLGKYRIPKGTMVVPLQWAIHMDPHVWKDPESFKPNRFIDEYGKLLKPQEFIPFQAGKRMCPGDELSRMLSVNFIVRLLRSFRIRLSSEPPTAEQMKGKVGFTLTPPKVQYICEPICKNC